LVTTFWSNSHFGLKIDFATNVVSNNKKIDLILIIAVNPLTETSYMTDEIPCLLTWH